MLVISLESLIFEQNRRTEYKMKTLTSDKSVRTADREKSRLNIPIFIFLISRLENRKHFVTCTLQILFSSDPV